MAQDIISLSLEPRTVTGKAVKHLRSAGQIPAVIHDHGKDSVVVQGEQVALLKVWKQAGKHHPVSVKAGSKSYTALIKEATFDPRKNMLKHVVFNAVNANETVDAEIPVQPKYAEDNDASPAERTGLIVLSQMDAVNVAAIPSSLPDVIYYDAEKLVDIGDHITVADLIVPTGVEIKAEPSQSVATVYEPSALAAANEASGGTAEAGEEAEVESANGEAEEETPAEASETDEKAE
jgi:large subunit ribosomal protein L25